METLYFEEIADRIQGVYTNLFLLAAKKQLNLKLIAGMAVGKVTEYVCSSDKPVSTGMNGLLFLSAVAQMMDCSLFDLLYMSDKEKERILWQMIDEVDIDELYDYDIAEGVSYFTYDFTFDDEYGLEVDYELSFFNVDDECWIIVKFFFLKEEGFNNDYLQDSVILWEGTEGDIYDFIVETIEDLEEEDDDDDDDEDDDDEDDDDEDDDDEDDDDEDDDDEDDDYDEDDDSLSDFKDFFMHAARKECSHKYIKVMATVPIYANQKVTSITFAAEYCAECGVYYIPESVYQTQIKPKGRLLCQVMSVDEYRSYKKMRGNDIDLNPQSILNMVGYNVNSKENLSDHQRQTILRYAIESGVITKKKTISYLEWFIKNNGANRGMENAVRKWKKDLQWVIEYNGKGDIIVGVRRVIVE